MSHAFEMLPVINNFAIRQLTIFASEYDYVKLGLRLENHLNEATIFYGYKEDDTLIEVTNYNKRLVEDKNYIDVACEDLFNILTDARIGEEIEIRIRYEHDNEETAGVANRIYEQFKIYSQTTKNPIYVHSLNLQIENASQLRSVLPYFNPNKLKELIILNWEEEPVDLMNVIEMDHWKNAKQIVLQCFFVCISFETISHCENVSMRVSRISADDIRALVNIASNSSCLKYFHIKYDDLSEEVTDQFLDNLIGEKQIKKIREKVRLSEDTIRAFAKIDSNSFHLKNFHIGNGCLNELVIEQFLNSSIGEEQTVGKSPQTNQSGKQVRLIGNNTQFVHNSDSNTICMYTFSDKEEDGSVETSKELTSLPEKSAMLCLSNHLIMEKIVRHFDFAELVVLRRVSRGSRRCVDFLKPDPKLVAMQFFVLDAIIMVEVFGINNNTRISFKAPDADIPATQSFFVIKDIDSLSDDLIQLLNGQKTALKELSISLDGKGNHEASILGEEQFIEMFNRTYSLRGSVFPVEKLILTTTCVKQVARILQNMDPISIKTIEIRTNWPEYIVSHIKELVCLEQWSNAEELKILGFIVECDLEKLVHFSKVDIWIESISMGDVLYLKEKFLSSSNFRQFKTKFSKTNVDGRIFEDDFLGEPFRRVEDISSDQPDIWFFPYPDSMEDLQIRYYRKAKEFMFKRVQRR